MLIVQNECTILFPDSMSEKEALVYTESEKSIWAAKGKKLGLVEIKIEGEEVTIKTSERSPIKRLRRITGYLSNINNFNDSKASELKDRHTHFGK